jgi:hypothetical protein
MSIAINAAKPMRMVKNTILIPEEGRKSVHVMTLTVAAKSNILVASALLSCLARDDARLFVKEALTAPDNY